MRAAGLGTVPRLRTVLQEGAIVCFDLLPLCIVHVLHFPIIRRIIFTHFRKIAST